MMKRWGIVGQRQLCIVAILAIELIFLALVCVAIKCNVLEGFRIGVITKAQDGGFVITSVRNKDEVSSAAVNTLAVTDPKVIDKLQALQDNGHRAKLVYRRTRNPVNRKVCYTIVDAIDLYPE